MKVALVHDWLVEMRGGEQVLQAIAELFPGAELFTLIYGHGRVSPELTVLKRHTSFLQKIPKIDQRYRYFLPLMPKAIELFDMSEFDLIISSSHCVAKGVKKRPDAVHVSYVHAPMRYMWDRYDDYFGPGRAAPWTRFAASRVRNYMRSWDRRVSQEDRVDTLIGNSRFIADRIKDAYGRDAEVVYPFVETERFKASNEERRNYVYLGAFAPNKRVDHAIEAFNRLDLPLIVIGSGQERKNLEKIAGPKTEFLGRLSNRAIEDILSKSKALIFPSKEDFGITPLEAMASGMPVIAYGVGGATETVTPETGVLYEPQTVDALVKAVQDFEARGKAFDPEICRKRALEFSKQRFQTEFLKVVNATLDRKRKAPLSDPRQTGPNVQKLT